MHESPIAIFIVIATIQGGLVNTKIQITKQMSSSERFLLLARYVPNVAKRSII